MFNDMYFEFNGYKLTYNNVDYIVDGYGWCKGYVEGVCNDYPETLYYPAYYETEIYDVDVEEIELDEITIYQEKEELDSDSNETLYKEISEILKQNLNYKDIKISKKDLDEELVNQLNQRENENHEWD